MEHEAHVVELDDVISADERRGARRQPRTRGHAPVQGEPYGVLRRRRRPLAVGTGPAGGGEARGSCAQLRAERVQRVEAAAA